MTTELIKSTVRLFFNAGLDPTELQYFDISALRDQVGTDSDYLIDYRPPFEKCAVVWAGPTRSHQHYEVLMLVTGADPAEGILVQMYKGALGHPARAVPTIVYLVDDDVVRYGPVNENEEVPREEAELILAMIAGWYSLLAKGSPSYSPRARDTFTNRRKASAGKLPQYDWRTVVITPQQPRSSAQGGTHASPRLHDRRGHLRRLRNGKNVWVRPHKVGRPELGTVFHDYEVKQ